MLEYYNIGYSLRKSKCTVRQVVCLNIFIDRYSLYEEKDIDPSDPCSEICLS